MCWGVGVGQGVANGQCGLSRSTSERGGGGEGRCMRIVARKDAWAHVWTVARMLFLVLNLDLSVIAWVSTAAAFLTFNLFSLGFFSLKNCTVEFLISKNAL